MTLTQAANHVGLASISLRHAVERGDVEALHPLPDGPWVFNRGDLDDAAFRQRFQDRLTGQKTPAGPNIAQLTL